VLLVARWRWGEEKKKGEVKWGGLLEIWTIGEFLGFWQYGVGNGIGIFGVLHLLTVGRGRAE